MAENTSRETFKYIEWKINGIVDRFRGFKDNRRREMIQSPSFRFNNAEWFLKIRSNTLMGDTLYIGLHKLNPEEHYVKFRIGLQKSDGSNTNITEEVISFGEGCNICEYDFRDQFAMLELSNDILTPDGSLTIFCFICLQQEPPMDNESQTPLPEAEIPAAKRQKTNSWQNGDVKINVNGKEFVAHRFILKQRSQYFENVLRENPPIKERVIFIYCCDSESFDLFLEYLYNSDIKILTSNNMFGLYKNSHECQVPALKEECIQFMKQELSIHTFIDIYNLSREYEDTNLLNFSIQFFMDNAKNIVITTKWQEYLEKKPDFGNKLFLDYLNFNNSK